MNAKSRFHWKEWRRLYRLFATLVVGSVGVASIMPGPASAAIDDPITITVHATANIYGAGHAVPPDPGGGGGGELPPVHEFPVGSGQVLQLVGIDGTISADNGVTFNGADGSRGPITVTPWEGISGIRDTRGGFYLVGVFLDDTEPYDPAPRGKDFSRAHNFTSISPPLGTVFFIGDGMGSPGVQTFHVPDRATRLFLGLADATNGQGPPGAYGDNLGELVVTFTLG